MQPASVLNLLLCEDQALLIRRNGLLVPDLSLHVPASVSRLDFQCNMSVGQHLHEDLHFQLDGTNATELFEREDGDYEIDGAKFGARFGFALQISSAFRDICSGCIHQRDEQSFELLLMGTEACLAAQWASNR
jgi:hypothetical protein